MKTFEYSFQHQHHHFIQAAASLVHHSEVPEAALDLTKPRRYSVESDTRKSSSYEELIVRESPDNAENILQLHNRDIPKLSTLTPEHSMQYHYNYEHTSPSTTSAVKNLSPARSPLGIYEKFDTLPNVRKIEEFSHEEKQREPSSAMKSFPITAASPHEHYERYEKIENSHFHSTPQLQSPMIEHDHEDSNDAPSANISSSSSVASSQKSPSSSTNQSMMVVTREGKLSRPFKAYPRDPLSLAAAGSILDGTSAEKYAVFRKRMLDQIHAANGGSVVVNNPKMRRISIKTSSEEANNNEPAFKDISDKVPKLPNGSSDKDQAYYERRRKNNAAAKKSRDRRRIKEDEIAIRAAFLERENIELKFELAAARKQLAIYTNGIAASN